MFFKRLIIISLAVFIQSAVTQTLTSGKTGTKDGYYYEYWRDNNNGSGTMTLGDSGNFSCSWSNISNILFRKGKRPGVRDQIIDYSATYNPSGNSYLAVYGWTRNPLVEYYIVESWGSWRPPGTSRKTTITVDGDKYDVYESTRVNQPSIDGNKTFQQYWSVRQNKRTKGVIHCGKHFDTWDGLNMKVGKFYEVSFVVEGYQSSGNADVKMSMTSESTGISDFSDNNNTQNTLTKVRNTNNNRRFEVTGNANTTISFSVPSKSIVSVKLFNLVGKEICEIGGKEYTAGTHAIALNTASLAKGVYYYSLKTIAR
ncbi:MAG TPA: glycoside hydrolase family 11 protein [Chitinispirillaceae bacterium]|nr:glycoside hydrolase family 11 protein [Chitinispirillaceae bacterium]